MADTNKPKPGIFSSFADMGAAWDSAKKAAGNALEGAKQSLVTGYREVEKDISKAKDNLWNKGAEVVDEVSKSTGKIVDTALDATGKVASNAWEVAKDLAAAPVVVPAVIVNGGVNAVKEIGVEYENITQKGAEAIVHVENAIDAAKRNASAYVEATTETLSGVVKNIDQRATEKLDPAAAKQMAEARAKEEADKPKPQESRVPPKPGFVDSLAAAGTAVGDIAKEPFRTLDRSVEDVKQGFVNAGQAVVDTGNNIASNTKQAGQAISDGVSDIKKQGEQAIASVDKRLDEAKSIASNAVSDVKADTNKAIVGVATNAVVGTVQVAANANRVVDDAKNIGEVTKTYASATVDVVKDTVAQIDQKAQAKLGSSPAEPQQMVADKGAEAPKPELIAQPTPDLTKGETPESIEPAPPIIGPVQPKPVAQDTPPAKAEPDPVVSQDIQLDKKAIQGAMKEFGKFRDGKGSNDREALANLGRAVGIEVDTDKLGKKGLASGAEKGLEDQFREILKNDGRITPEQKEKLGEMFADAETKFKGSSGAKPTEVAKSSDSPERFETASR